MEPIFFATPADFRKWLQKNHKTATEVLVGFYKKGTEIQSITWPESVELALCFGWIDSVRRSIDDKSYTNRFTPRRPGSNWSAMNIKKVAELTAAGLMLPEGIEAFEKRTENKSAVYSYENETPSLSKPFEKIFKTNKKAWEFFNAQAPWYKRVSVYHVMSAKQEKTRMNRLLKLIQASESGNRL